MVDGTGQADSKIEAGKSLRSVANRIYSGMFYAVFARQIGIVEKGE